MHLPIDEKITLIDNLQYDVDEQDLKNLIKILEICDIKIADTIIQKLMTIIDKKGEKDKWHSFISDTIQKRIISNQDNIDSILKLVNILNGLNTVLDKNNRTITISETYELSPILIQLIENSPPEKRCQYLKNKSFSQIFVTSLLISMIRGKKDDSIRKITVLLTKSDNDDEKVALLDVLAQRPELLSDADLLDIIIFLEKQSNSEVISNVESILSTLLGKKPENVSWRKWLENSSDESGLLKKVTDQQRTIKERTSSYTALCRKICRDKSLKNPFEDSRFRSLVIKIIYNNDENIEFRKYLFFQILGHANYEIEQKQQIKPDFKSAIKSLLMDFVSDPRFSELYIDALPPVFDDENLIRHLQNIMNSPTYDPVCRAGACWQLLFKAKNKEEARKHIVFLFSLLSDEIKGSNQVQLDNLNEVDTFIMNFLLMMAQEKIGFAKKEFRLNELHDILLPEE